MEVANTEFSIFRRVRGTPPFFSKPPLNGKRISSFLDNDHPNRRTGLEIKPLSTRWAPVSFLLSQPRFSAWFFYLTSNNTPQWKSNFYHHVVATGEHSNRLLLLWGWYCGRTLSCCDRSVGGVCSCGDRPPHRPDRFVQEINVFERVSKSNVNVNHLTCWDVLWNCYQKHSFCGFTILDAGTHRRQTALL